MAPKNKKNINEFYFFMIERKPEVERRMGRTVSMNELPGLLYTEWKNLPKAQKQRFIDLKNQGKKTVEKLDCRGIPLSELRQKEQEEREKFDRMTLEIRNVVHMGALQKKEFFIIHTNYYVQTDDGKFPPAEIGLVLFSLEKGIVAEFHKILEADIPSGYRYEAKSHSENTHMLPLDSREGVSSFREVHEDLYKFISQAGDTGMPFYTMDDDREQTEGVLDYISDGGFLVYSLEMLFCQMYSVVFPKMPIPISIGRDKLNHCGFDFHIDIACKWHIDHQPDAINHCSLSIARRKVYIICDNMDLRKFNITPKEYRHMPPRGKSSGLVMDDREVDAYLDEDLEDDDNLFVPDDTGSVVSSLSLNTIGYKSDAWETASVARSLAGSVDTTRLQSVSEQEFPVLGQGRARNKDQKGAAPGTVRYAGIQIPAALMAGVGRGRKLDSANK